MGMEDNIWAPTVHALNVLLNSVTIALLTALLVWIRRGNGPRAE